MYDFKFWQEVGWAVLTGVIVAVATILVDFDPETVTDWHTWAIAGAGSVARATGAALLTAFGRQATQ